MVVKISKHTRQSGSMIIYVVIILLMVGLATATSLQLASTGVMDSDMAEREMRAFYLAESAVERQRSLYNTGQPCLSLARDPVSGYYDYEDGQIAVIAAEVTVAPHCLVTVEARIGDVVRRIKVDLYLGDSEGLFEPFPSLADFNEHWTGVAVPPNNDGAFNWDGAENCPLATCPVTLVGSGSLHINTNNGGHYQAKFRRGFAPTVSTGATGLDFVFSIGYKKTRNQGQATETYMGVAFYDSTNDVETIIWENTQSQSAPWTRDEITISLPPNMQYDEVRLVVDLKGRTKKHKFQEVNTEVWFDQFRVPNLWGPGGASLGGWEEV